MNEIQPRRPGSDDGHSLVLADGRSWIVPRPLAPESADYAEYRELVEAVCESSEPGERRRGELSLLIFLLDRNYELKPAALQELLTARTPIAASALDESLRTVVAEHLAVVAETTPSAARPGLFTRTWLALQAAVQRRIGRSVQLDSKP